MNKQPIIRWEGRFLRVIQEGRWEYADRVKTSGAVAIVAVTEDARLVLTEQYRIPMGKRVIELPAGSVVTWLRPRARISRKQPAASCWRRPVSRPRQWCV